MYIPDFKYHKPKSISETVSVLNSCESGILIAGGTDILVEIKKGVRKVSDLISLSSVEELRMIKNDPVSLSIGPCLTHNEIISSEIINKEVPALAEACSKIGSHQVRNTATLGGNLCTSASCADTAPVLLAYGALVRLSSVNGEREMPLIDFMQNHHKTSILPNEILSAVIIPKPKTNTIACFEKFGLRDAASISVASVSVLLSFENKVCINAKIVVGACSPIPMVSENAGNILLGKQQSDFTVNDELLNLAADQASKDSKPITDIRGTAGYRRHLVKVLTVLAIKKCLNQIAN